MGLHIASFGYDAYRESMFRFAAGKLLNENLSLGISLQYAILQSELFETSASRLSVDLGASWRVVDNWLITASVVNFPSKILSSENIDSERIAVWTAEVGVNWQIFNNLLITGGARRNRETPFGAAFGIEYQPFTDFQIRAGVSSGPFRPSLGIGYGFSKITADVVMIYHPVLGVSTGLGVAYTF
jgi:outer membrane receptor for ferrienterochelin and colicin